MPPLKILVDGELGWTLPSPPLPYYYDPSDPPMGMYGLYPACFFPYDTDDPEYSYWDGGALLEINWLLAMWPYYIREIAKGKGYKLSQRGVELGMRLTHEEQREHDDVVMEFFAELLSQKD